MTSRSSWKWASWVIWKKVYNSHCKPLLESWQTVLLKKECTKSTCIRKRNSLGVSLASSLSPNGIEYCERDRPCVLCTKISWKSIFRYLSKFKGISPNSWVRLISIYRKLLSSGGIILSSIFLHRHPIHAEDKNHHMDAAWSLMNTKSLQTETRTYSRRWHLQTFFWNPTKFISEAKC